MRSLGIVTISSVMFLTNCAPSGPLAIQKIISTDDIVQINFDPNQRTNAQMRKLAQDQCKKRKKVLKDVTVAPTSVPTTSTAVVFCE